MATPIRVTIELKDVWDVDAVKVVTDDGVEHYVPMTSTMQNTANSAASVGLGLFGQPLRREDQTMPEHDCELPVTDATMGRWVCPGCSQVWVRPSKTFSDPGHGPAGQGAEFSGDWERL